jgi:sialidase-1
MSADDGKTWGSPVVVDPLFALCRNGSVRVLRSGRIVAPTLKWISSAAGPESESDDQQMVFSWIYYSDDEGKTWQRSLSELFVSLDGGQRGFYSFDEPVLEELNDDHLIMIARTQLGRPYKSFSKDGGTSWSNPAPVNLASSDSPHTLIRVPSTSDLLLVWNQASTEECLTGLMRHRLSTAISSDGGERWGHFRNLESLDDRSYIEPPAEPRVYLMRDGKFIEPTDHQRYPHAPGCLRNSYPTVAFSKDEVAIAYDYGYGGPGELQNGSATKIQVATLGWLYGKQA